MYWVEKGDVAPFLHSKDLKFEVFPVINNVSATLGERIFYRPITASLTTKQERRTTRRFPTWRHSYLAICFAREFFPQFSVNKNVSHTLQ